MIGLLMDAIQAAFCQPEPIDWEAKRMAEEQRIVRLAKSGYFATAADMQARNRHAEDAALDAFCRGYQWTPDEIAQFRAQYETDSIEPRLMLPEPIIRRNEQL